jgi:MazG family protein
VEGTQETPGPTPADSESLDRALALVEFLRARCPWDAAQTPETLLRHLVEETYEVVDSVIRGDDLALGDELGDLLLNLAFQVVLGEERGTVSRGAVVRQLEQKLRRRHPHLYGGEAEPWERIKARERAERSGESRGSEQGGILTALPRGLDPLLRAQRMQELVARVGFDWPDARGAWEKVIEEAREVGVELDTGEAEALQDEIGDLLFSVVNLARLSGVFAPAALARSNAKFMRRFERLERLATQRGVSLGEADLASLDELWIEVKNGERSAGPERQEP